MRTEAKVLQSDYDEAWDEQRFVGKRLSNQHKHRILDREPIDVIGPDGSPLLLFRPGILSEEVCEQAYVGLRGAASNYNPHRRLHSQIAGYYDEPECRTTSWTAANLSQWPDCLPFVEECNRVFRRELPSRYIPQRKLAYQTDPEWTIGDTCFTTLTVNRWDEYRDSQTVVHKDDGDLPEGFGVISVLRTGNYTGGELLFPEYGIGVDLHTTDVLLFDPHEYHANLPVEGEPGWGRLSTVLYYRTEMQRCKNTRDRLYHAQRPNE